MRLAFVDIAYGYTADRPDTAAPLGGTTSAICFLARELVKAGVGCTFFNKIAAPAEAHGIKSLPLAALAHELADPGYTAFIFCGRWMADMVGLARGATRAPLVAWMHESTFNPKLVPALDAFDAIAFVSEWQRRINQPYAKPRWKQAVMRNAMNPRAAGLFAPGEAILAAKAEPPVLLYAGGAARGAFHLPKILDELRGLRTDFSLEIFCNTNPSGDAAQDAKYINWLRGLPNVAHVGMVGQNELIRRMKRAAVFIAPNPWPETSCIALIEAMAAGLAIVATSRAALPETASGFARLIAIDNPDDPARFDAPVDHAAFAKAINEALAEQKTGAIETRLRAQVDYFLNHYQWGQRVAEWIGFVRGLQH